MARGKDVELDVDHRIHELREAGDRILATITVRGRGRASGVEVEWTA